MEGLARQQPVLLVFDDLHWIDPSSRELLDRLIERVVDWPVLLLALFRPEFQPPWVGQPQVTLLSLTRLDRQDTVAAVGNVAGDTALPPEIVAEIAERTDGVPLFIEELTKAVLETGAQAPATLSAMPHPSLLVPATLHASLMARLDRLGPIAKEIAQAGAAIGREFGYGLVASITDLPEPQLRETIDRLTNASLVFARGTPPDASYLFKHALVQDAAYRSLLRSRRQRLHGRIATTLEERFPEIVRAQPALLAQHYTAAQVGEKAVAYWLKAGKQAAAGSATMEAITQLKKGLNVLADLPDGPWRRQQELDLQITLSWVLNATEGWATANVAEALTRALTLAEQIDRPECLVPLIVGQWAIHFARAEHKLAVALAEQFEQIGEARKDIAAQLLGRYTHGISRFFLGEFVAARNLLERCFGLADVAHRTTEGLTVNPYVTMLTFLALTQASLGYIDQARARMEEALSEARRLRHAYTQAHTLSMANWLDWLTRWPMVHVEEMLALTTQNGFQSYLGWARAFRGRLLLTQGMAQDSLALLTQGLTELRKTGGIACTTMLVIWLAEAHALRRQPSEALAYLDETAQIVEATDERFAEAELLHRVPGDLLNASGDRSGAERHYCQAIAVAERQGAKLFQLRASASLARLWRDRGRRTEARDLLAPIYSWFTEGFDAPDLKEAKALLDKLA